MSGGERMSCGNAAGGSFAQPDWLPLNVRLCTERPDNVRHCTRVATVS